MSNRNADYDDTIKYRDKKPLNVWILVSILVFIYLIVYFCIYAFNDKVSFCEVTEGITSGKFDAQYSALAIRDEKLVTAEDSGYINYFVGDGSRVYVGEDAFILDKKGDVSEKLEETAKNNAVLNGNDLNKLKDSIYDFDTSFSDQNFYDVYSYKYKLDSQILDFMNDSILQETIDNIGASSDYTIYKSGESGVLLHNYDGYEGLTYKDLESSYFKKSNYHKTLIKANDHLNKGDPAYKVISSDEWYLVIQIMDEHAFEGIDHIDITFLKDNISTSCDFEIFTKAGNTYGVITLQKYMVRYISDRFVQIKIYEDFYEGLKIPKTAVLEQQLFIIPREYMTQGGNNNTYGFMLKNGDSAVFVTPTIVMSNDEYVYVTTDNGILTDGDVLIRSDSIETYTVTKKENRQGVYAIDNGYASFKVIEILGENNNNYIINPKTNNGIRLYDQVIEDYHYINEGQEVF